MEVSSRSPTEDWLEDCLEATTVKKLPVPVRGPPKEVRQTEIKEIRTASKPHSTPRTLKWLEENYELAEGVCIPRNALYLHYQDFCAKNDHQPVNAASFGKIIRQQFPQITTRRLGTRGQSKYHYYGVGIRETSQYYEVMYSKKGVQNSAEGRKETVKQIVAYSPRSKLGTLLPEFPNVKDLKLPADVSEDKVTTFLMMYRTHCQRILDTVIRANFDEVQSFLLHFWQGMPQHIVPVLGTQIIVNLVGVCDSVLYKAISGVLMPTVLQPLPDSLTQVIRNFARQLDEWLHLALEGLPETLIKMKFDLARRFAQVLKRQTSLNHLCQAARTVIHSSDILEQMLDDWSSVDLSSICKQTLYTMDMYREVDHKMIINLYSEFEGLLEEQAPIESYTEWLNSMVDKCVVKPSAKKVGSLRRIARQFLLMWSCFGTRVIRDMTLHSAPSFGSFHLLHLMFDDYVLYLVENLHSQERSSELLRSIKGEEVQVDPQEEAILPNPCVSHLSVSPSAVGSSPPVSSYIPTTLDRQSVITSARENFNNFCTGSPDGTSSDSSTSPMPDPRSTVYGSVPRSSPEDHMMKEADYQYGGCASGVSGMTPGLTYTSPDTNYCAPGSVSQYNYRERDYNAERPLECWPGEHRADLTPSTGYGYNANAQYGTLPYRQDYNAYSSNMRPYDIDQQSGYYSYYYGNNCDFYPHNNNGDLANRKRKSDIDESSSITGSKRVPGLVTGYYDTMGNSYGKT